MSWGPDGSPRVIDRAARLDRLIETLTKQTVPRPGDQFPGLFICGCHTARSGGLAVSALESRVPAGREETPTCWRGTDAGRPDNPVARNERCASRSRHRSAPGGDRAPYAVAQLGGRRCHRAGVATEGAAGRRPRHAARRHRGRRPVGSRVVDSHQHRAPRSRGDGSRGHGGGRRATTARPRARRMSSYRSTGSRWPEA